MKNRNRKNICRCSLITILSIIALTCVACHSRFQQGQSETQAVNPSGVYEIKPFTQVDYTWGENEQVCSLQVLEEERRILFEVADTHIIQDEQDGDVFNTDCQNSIYEWDIAACSMSTIDMGGHKPCDIAWEGRNIFFMDATEEMILYTAVVINGALENIRPVMLESADIKIIECIDVSENRILFVGVSAKDGARSYYIGTLEDDHITTISPLKGILGNETLSAAYFVGDDSVLGEVIVADSMETEGLEAEFRLWHSGSTKIEMKDLIELDDHFGLLPPISTNISTNTLYYLQDNVSIYQVSLTAFVNKAMQNVSKESEPYIQGSFSCDLYDTGDFVSEQRNKIDETQKGGVYYEIFVRSFADSDGDGIGDLNGITENLDYLQELGIDGIWLMPVNASASYHGYDVTDYMSLNSDYGTIKDLKRLLDEAHARKIRVIMDFVINHTSSEHPWFQAALKNESSEYRDYYRWVHKNDTVDFNNGDTSNWGSRVWHKSGDFYYYAMFGADMPDLNYNNPKVREAIKEAAGKWLELGVDGFRMDAAMHIYGINEFKQEDNPTQSTLTWWNEFARYCESINPNVYLVGEVWQDDKVLEEYVQPFDTKFNFTFQNELLYGVSNQTALSDSGERLSFLLQNILNVYDTVDSNYLDGVFGSNHDQERVMSTVKDTNKARQVAAIYMTLPGNPYIYYGEELGMLGQKPDEMIRTPFLWGDGNSNNTSWMEDDQNVDTPTLKKQLTDRNSMYSFYKKLIAFRKAHTALTQGEYVAMEMEDDSVMAYVRENKEEKLLVIHNLSESEQTLDLQRYGAKEIVFSTNQAKCTDITDKIITISGNDSVILVVD